MTQRIYSRGPLTDSLIAYFNAALSATSTVLEIGDGIAPPDAGWQGGQPGAGTFKPYAVVNAMQAGTHFTESVRGRLTSWQQPYSLLCVGGSRQQCDWVSDQLKPAVTSYWNATPGQGPRQINLDDPWKVTKSTYTGLGAPSRNDQVDPPVWEATDAIVLWLEHATI